MLQIRCTHCSLIQFVQDFPAVHRVSNAGQLHLISGNLSHLEMQTRQRYCHAPKYIHSQMKTVVENVKTCKCSRLLCEKDTLHIVYENSTFPLRIELVLSLKWQLKALPFLESFFNVCAFHSVKLNGFMAIQDNRGSKLCFSGRPDDLAPHCTWIYLLQYLSYKISKIRHFKRLEVYAFWHQFSRCFIPPFMSYFSKNLNFTLIKEDDTSGAIDLVLLGLCFDGLNGNFLCNLC